MDSKLDNLLEKYWNAETSVEEETVLRRLLKESDQEEVKDVDVLMDYFEGESSKELDASFDEALLAQIQEPETKVVNFNTYFKRYASIAAAVLVMVISSVMFMQNQAQYTSEDTFESPEEAYAELKKQLMIVSNYMNKGNNTVNELSTLGSATDELSVIGKMSSAQAGLNMLEEMNVNN